MSVIVRLQNLPWAANAADIRQYFSGLSIPDGGVHIVGGERGDAFIAFSTDEDARLAMIRDSGKIKEENIKLFLSSRAEMQKVIDSARQQAIQMHFMNMQKNMAFMQLPGMQQPPIMPGMQQPSIMPGMQQPATVPGMQQPAAVSGLQQPPTMPGMQQPLTMPGMQQPPTMPGIQQPANLPGMQPPPIMPGMQQPPTMPGMQTLSAMQMPTNITGTQVPGMQGLQTVPNLHIPGLPMHSMYGHLMQKPTPETQSVINSKMNPVSSSVGMLSQQTPRALQTAIPATGIAPSMFPQAVTSTSSLAHHSPSLPPQSVHVTRPPSSVSLPYSVASPLTTIPPVTNLAFANNQQLPIGTRTGISVSTPPSRSPTHSENQNKSTEVTNHDKKDRHYRRSHSYESRSRSRSHSRDRRSRDKDRYYDKERRRRRSRSRDQRRRRRDRSRSRDGRRDRKRDRRDHRDQRSNNGDQNFKSTHQTQRNAEKTQTDMYGRTYQRGFNTVPTSSTSKLTVSNSENRQMTETVSTTEETQTSEASTVTALTSATPLVSDKPELSETVSALPPSHVQTVDKPKPLEMTAILPPPPLPLALVSDDKFKLLQNDLDMQSNKHIMELTKINENETKESLCEEEKSYDLEAVLTLPTVKQNTNDVPQKEATESFKQNCDKIFFNSPKNSDLEKKDSEIKYPEPFRPEWKKVKSRRQDEVPDACVNLKHFPPYTRYIDIKQFFQGLFIPHGNIKMQRDEAGSAFIRFTTLNNKKKAMMKNGSLLNNSVTVVSHIDDKIFDSAEDNVDPARKSFVACAPHISGIAEKNNVTGTGSSKGLPQAKKEQLQQPTSKKRITDVKFEQCLKLEGTYVINPVYDSMNHYHERIDKFIKEHKPIDMFVNRNSISTVNQAFFKFENETQARNAFSSLQGTKVQDVFIKISLILNTEYAKEKERKTNAQKSNIGMSSIQASPVLNHESGSNFGGPPPLLNLEFSNNFNRPAVPPSMNRESDGNFCGPNMMYGMPPPMFMNEMNRMPMMGPSNNSMQNKLMPPPSFPQFFPPPNSAMGNDMFRMNSEMPHMSPNEMPAARLNDMRMHGNEQAQSDNNNHPKGKVNDPRMNNNNNNHRQMSEDMETQDQDAPFLSSRPLLPTPPMDPISNYDQKQPQLNTNCIIMQGLPLDANDKDITNFFADIDIIPTQIHIMLDRNRMPTGDAYCEFERLDEAVTAARKNNCQIGSKFVHVRMVSREELRNALWYDFDPDGGNSNFSTNDNHPPPYFENAKGERLSGQEPNNQNKMMRSEMFPPGRRGGGNNQFSRNDGPFSNRENSPFSNREFNRGDQCAERMSGYNGNLRNSFSNDGNRGRPQPLMSVSCMNTFRRSPSPQLDNTNVDQFGKPGCVIAAQNIPFRANIDQILGFFSEFRIDPENVIRRYDNSGNVTGDARIAFDSPSDARRALKLNNKMIFGRRILLTLAR